MTAEAVKLLPCPFCGANAEFIPEEGVPTNLGNVYCIKCMAKTRGDLQTRENAINHWNTRHATEPKWPEKYNILSKVTGENLPGSNSRDIQYQYGFNEGLSAVARQLEKQGVKVVWE